MSGIVVKLDGVTLTAPAWLVKPWGDLQLNSAADGSGATGSLLIDDKDGTQRIRGWQKVEIDEPLCVAANNGLLDAPRLFTGYVGRRTYSRGPYKSGPGRYIQVELYDVNILLNTRLITGGDAPRPSETDTARLAWLIGSDYLDGLVQDLGLVTGTGLEFDATDTHGQYPSQVLQDLTSTYDQLFFAYYDQVAEAVGLFFDFPNATTNTSALSISNDLADIDDDTVWAPHLDGQLDADPADVYSNVRYVYSGGVVYQTRAATNTEFFTDNDLLIRGTQVEQSKIGKASTASTFASRFLSAAAHERLSLTCTVRLPATHVNLLDSGMRTLVKFTHLPDYGYDDFSYLRIQNREVTQVDALSTIGSDLMPWYDVKLTLALTGLASIGSGGGPGGSGPPPPGDFPHQPPGPTHWYGGTIDFASDGGGCADSNLLPGGGTNYNPTTDKTVGSTILGTVTILSGVTYNYDVTENCSPLDAIVGNKEFGLWTDGSGGVYSGSFHVIDTESPPTGTVHWSGSFTPGSNFTGAFGFSQPAAGHTVKEVQVTWWIDPVGWVTNPDDGPQPAQWTEWAPVTMTGATGTTDFPYATGSLEIKVDDILIDPSAYTETDNTTGDFTLDWVPDADEVVTVRYQGL